MQTQTVESAFATRLRRATICLSVLFGLLCAAGASSALGWWHEAQLPMSPEKYAALCGENTPECYPEIGYVLAALMVGTLAASAGLLTVIFGGISLLPARFLAGPWRDRPTA